MKNIKCSDIFIPVTFLILLSLATTYFLIPSNAIKISLINSFSYVCHQNPDRSYKLLENQMLICSRCTGIYTGIVITNIIVLISKRLKKIFSQIDVKTSVIFLVPITIDWFINFLFNVDSGNFVRFITGFLSGFALLIVLANFESKD